MAQNKLNKELKNLRADPIPQVHIQTEHEARASTRSAEALLSVSTRRAGTSSARVNAARSGTTLNAR
jgi:hypothetical protein